MVKPAVLPKPVAKPKMMEAPRLETAKLDVPKIEAPTIELARRPEPKLVMPDPAPAPAPAKMASIQTGVFGTANSPAAGVHPATAVVRAGGFDVASGPTSSRGSSGSGVRTVALGGFGNGGIGAGGNGSNVSSGGVRSSGFGDYAASSGSPAMKPAAVTKPAVTPVEILSKPKPAYTTEARERRVEGEVQLEVVFSSSGTVQVLRVVRGLGMGLDESARVAARQIRFRPGTREGSPVDMHGIVHIEFRLS